MDRALLNYPSSNFVARVKSALVQRYPNFNKSTSQKVPMKKWKELIVWLARQHRSCHFR